ncbi:uncharacterized protein LOC131073844 [Cryptomeria japonica]|uniref:uncharacterized protein LOC131073844 n=1 Tax=Cryptomeria japonica TaxID=3369 RepID=UPI0027DA11B1|nr:uncharacterized protein LOC131073844 [Cryptomeria japonica]
MDFGSSDDEIKAQWERFSNNYHPWHVHRTTSTTTEESDTSTPASEPEQIQQDFLTEWQALSALYPGIPIQLDELDMLGQREIDLSHDWGKHHIPTQQKVVATTFIHSNRTTFQSHHVYNQQATYDLSIQQQRAYDLVITHLQHNTLKPPLKIIVQGTAGTRKSHLITSIKSTMMRLAPPGQSPLLLLAPIGVATFNIQASTIHSALRIPIKEMVPLQGQTLASFQESMYFIHYILIDEMSFIGHRLIQCIDMRLCEAFPTHNQIPFGGRSIILFGDLGQLPPVKDIPMYASNSYGGTLWQTFTTIITLDKIFRQIGEQPTQIAFHELLSDLRNATPTIEDWQLLMSRSSSSLTSVEQSVFLPSKHLFATNEMVSLHNKRMLLSLAKPVALSTAEQMKGLACSNPNDEQLQSNILLCIGQEVMLSTNLWVETGLVNGALGQVREIVYNDGEHPPQLPLFVVVQFQNYTGPPWDHNNPTNIPIPPISRGLRRQMPLKMAWALTIHKSQGLTLQRATIDIGNIDQQGMTFTAISRVRNLTSLHIHPAFTFERYARMQQSPHVTRRKEEEALLKILSDSQSTVRSI